MIQVPLVLLTVYGLFPATSFQDSDRTPIVVESVAEQLARLDQLVSELILVAQGEGEDAQLAMNGLLRARQRIDEEGRRRVRAQAQASPPDLGEQNSWVEAISQFEDSARRDQALREVEAALVAGPESRKIAACNALTRCSKVEFEKAPFRAPVRALAQSSTGQLRVAALYALFNTVRQPEDLSLALALAQDPSPAARQSGPHLLHLFGQGDLTGATGTAVVQMFEGSTAGERRSMLSGIWGARVSPELEALILGYSRSTDREESYDAMYYALSTFEDKSALVVERLIESLPSTDPNIYQRVLWGLGHGVPEEHAHLVVDAARTFLAARSDPSLKANALHLLGQYAGPDLAPELQAIADDARQAEMVRNAARAALDQVLAR